MQARRHLADGQLRVVLTDMRCDQRLVVGAREWRVLEAMDGTRDLEGITRASGLAPDLVEAFVTQVQALGLTGEPYEGSAASPARDVPVRALPGYRFACTGIGACCAMADSVLFTPLEAARARASAPSVFEAGQDEARAFLPERGLDRSLLAVAMCEGACAYLEGDGRCGIYDARPHGCRTFPARYVDVGVEIRVAPRLACACELEPGDAPMTSATRGAELPPELWVETLPARVQLGADELDAERALAWSDALEWPAEAVMERARERADALGARALDRGALAATLAQIRAQHVWRGPADRLRRSIDWLCEAVDRDEAQVRPEDEAWAAAALVFVGGLLVGGDVGRALRAFETRLFLARRLDPQAMAEPFARHPIALVNAVARGTGL